jgi:hypothetical protein
MIVGIVLMLVGGALMLKGSYSSKTKHEANIFGAKVAVTGQDEKRIPLALSGTLLGVGAVITVIGALKAKKQ